MLVSTYISRTREYFCVRWIKVDMYFAFWYIKMDTSQIRRLYILPNGKHYDPLKDQSSLLFKPIDMKSQIQAWNEQVSCLFFLLLGLNYMVIFSSHQKRCSIEFFQHSCSFHATIWRGSCIQRDTDFLIDRHVGAFAPVVRIVIVYTY
jgi:hypothetical protein